MDHDGSEGGLGATLQPTLGGQGATVIRLCGLLVVELNGRRLERMLPSRQGRMVFAYLVLQRGRPVSRDELIEALWPEQPPASPEALLTGLLSRLRNVLPVGVLTGRSQLSLQLGPDAWIDVEVAAAAVERAEAAFDAGDAVQAMSLAGEALAITEQPLLPDVDRTWVDEHRRRLDGIAPQLLEVTARAGLAGGELSRAETAVRRLIDREPLRESAYALLMEILARRGDAAHALQVYDDLRRLLREELGTIPGAAVRAIGDRLLQAEPRGSDAPAGPPGMPWPPALPPPLARTAQPVGRDAAVARLEALWADTAAVGLRVALLAGEPGIGKTTVVGELARRVHGHGAVVLYGRCDTEALVPFQPWVEALERHLEALEPAERQRWLTGRGGALARLLPGLGAAADASSLAAHRYLAFEAVRAVLEETAAFRPLLLVLDDLHWADPGSLQLLRHVVRLAGGARALLVACGREDELTPEAASTLGEVRCDAALVQLTLTGLDADAISELIARRTGARDADRARRLHERTAGNPFFLDELLRDQEERGHGASGLPPAVRDVVRARVARLNPSAQEALSLAALMGLQFDVRVLAAAAGRAVGEALAALDGAAAAGLVVSTGSTGGFAFAHALIAETLVAAMSPSRRAATHLRIAEAMERRTTGDPNVPAGQIAWHLRAAGPLATGGRLAAWEVTAARDAARALAYEEAARHYESALAALPDGGSGPDRAELLLSLGHAHDRAGRREAARRAFVEAARLARDPDSAGLLARAALGHGGLAVVIAAPDPAVTRLLEEALAAIPRDALATRARLRARLAVELCYSDPARAETLSSTAVADARAAAEPAALAAALNARRAALWTPMHADERLAAATEMVEAADAAGDRESALQGDNWRVVDLLELGRVAEAAAAVDAYDARAQMLGLPHYRWYVPLWRGCLALLGGRWSETAAQSTQALALGRQADDPNAAFLVQLQFVHGLAQQGRFADIDRASIAEKAAEPLAGVAWKAGLALVDAEVGDTDSARRRIAELTRGGSARLPMNANWHAACLLAEATANVGDREAAAMLYALLRPHVRLFPVVARGVSCYGSTEYFVGRLAAVLGRLDEAESRLRRAVSENDRAGAQPRVALALNALGEVLAARSRRAEARDALAEAAERAEALQMPALATRAHRASAAQA